MRAGLLIAAFAAVACAAPPPPPPPPKPVVVGPPTDTVRTALTDLGRGTYYGHQGGIYPNGFNQPPPDHDSAARAHRNRIRALDVNGDESPFGKYVLLLDRKRHRESGVVLRFVSAAVWIVDAHGPRRSGSGGESRIARDREWGGEERLERGLDFSRLREL